MNSDGVREAFDLLRVEVENALDGLKEEGAKAFKAGKLDEVLALQGRAARVTELIDKLKGLEQEVLRQLDFPQPENGKGQEDGPARPGWWEIPWTKKKPISFTLYGKREPVSTFKGVLMGVCRGLQGRHGSDFRRILSLPPGRTRQYFSESPKGMTEPRQFPGGGIWVETNLSGNNIRDLCRDVLRHFGHAEDALEVQVQERARSAR